MGASTKVHNAFIRPKSLPRDVVERFANRTMHLKGAQLDIVRLDAATGKEISPPLYEVYRP